MQEIICFYMPDVGNDKNTAIGFFYDLKRMYHGNDMDMMYCFS